MQIRLQNVFSLLLKIIAIISVSSKCWRKESLLFSRIKIPRRESISVIVIAFENQNDTMTLSFRQLKAHADENNMRYRQKKLRGAETISANLFSLRKISVNRNP